MRAARRSDIWIVVAVVAALLYSNFLIDWALRGFTHFGIVVSSLEAPGQPNAGVLRITDVVCALLVLLLLPAARKGLAPGWAREAFVACTVVFAVGAIIAAAVPMPCGIGEACESPSQRLDVHIHDIASIVSETALFLGVLAAWWTARRDGPRWLATAGIWLFWLGGVIGTSLFAWFGWKDSSDPMTGYVQRFHIVTVSIWIVCVGLLARTRRTEPPTRGTPS